MTKEIPAIFNQILSDIEKTSTSIVEIAKSMEIYFNTIDMLRSSAVVDLEALRAAQSEVAIVKKTMVEELRKIDGQRARLNELTQQVYGSPSVIETTNDDR